MEKHKANTGHGRRSNREFRGHLSHSGGQQLKGHAPSKGRKARK
jgi:hypothetical protein